MRTDDVNRNQAHILTLVKKLMMKILNLKLMILIEHKNIKSIFAKGSKLVY